MKIENSKHNDIDEIFRLYQIATDYMKSKNMVHWPDFERDLIEKEIEEKRQWKITIDNEIACIWVASFDDPQIWEELNADPAIYIHRIATNPKFRGNNLLGNLIEFVKKMAIQNQKRFLRMDTVGENHGLIDYYTKCGFNFLGLSKLDNTDGLPSHYHNATVCLFELDLDKGKTSLE